MTSQRESRVRLNWILVKLTRDLERWMNETEELLMHAPPASSQFWRRWINRWRFRKNWPAS